MGQKNQKQKNQQKGQSQNHAEALRAILKNQKHFLDVQPQQQPQPLACQSGKARQRPDQNRGTQRERTAGGKNAGGGVAETLVQIFFRKVPVARGRVSPDFRFPVGGFVGDGF